MKILIVDDNDFSITLLSSMLGVGDYEIIKARDGEEAINLFANSEENEIGLILMDIVMENLRGDYAAKEIRSMDRTDAKAVKIYATTAHNAIEYAEDFDGVLKKPFDRQAVKGIIDSL